MVKFKKLWLFEHSEFQRFLNFIIAQCLAVFTFIPRQILERRGMFNLTKPILFNKKVSGLWMIPEPGK